MVNILTFSHIVEQLKLGASLTTDSRKVKALVEEGKFAIYVALSGERFDGNNFVGQALEDGAQIVVCDRTSITPSAQIMVVEDSLVALQQIASLYRNSLNCKIIAVTGSNGKTTTKELLYAALSTKYICTATQGNLNNHIGVPLTLLSISAQCQVAIVEMGANHQKEIELLCSIANPNYGIITNIGKAHLEGFGGREGIVAGKGELFDYLNQNRGVAFYLSESEILSTMVSQRPNLVGVPYNSSFLAIVESGLEGVVLSYNNNKFKTHLVGDYNLLNIAAAFTVARYFNVEDCNIAKAIEGYLPSNMRSQSVKTECNRVVVDAYNANPTSMQGAIETFLCRSNSPLKLFILGDMKELGCYAEQEHEKVAKMVSESGFSAVLIGSHFASCGNYKNVVKFETTQSAYNYLAELKPNGFDILLKGSRSVGVEKLLELL